MAVLSFEIEESEVSKIRTILKALGAKKLKVKEDETKMSKEEFYEKLKRAKSGSGTILETEKDIHAFFDSL